MSNDTEMNSVLKRVWSDLDEKDRVKLELISKILEIERLNHSEPLKAKQAIALEIAQYVQAEVASAKS